MKEVTRLPVPPTLPAPGPEAQPVLDEEAWHEVEVVVVERQGKGIRKVTTSNVLVFYQCWGCNSFCINFF